MPFSLPSIPYPPAGPGYWGSVTSTINWCEEDYYATSYCAEIVNAFTNSTFVYLAYKGISSCIRQKHATIFLVAFLSYLIIGFGSIFFHSSLKYSMQLLDELSMIYTTCIMFYALFSHRQSRQRSLLIFLCISGVAIFITAYYHYLQDPAFHQNAFALLTIILVLRSMYIMENLLRPSRQSGYSPQRGEASTYEEKEKARKAARDTEILNTMWQMIGCGLGAVACGFLIWSLDNIYCGVLRRWRREIGLPWGILLEGHGWWHIMTGIAAYYNLTWAIWLSYCRDGKQDEVQLVWPSLFTAVPDLVKKNNVKSSHDTDSSISKKGI